MLVAVGLSARLNYEHEALLGYPLVGRVLFVAPSVLSGWLFELQLRSLRRERLYATGRIAKPVPQFGLIVWGVPPLASTQAPESDHCVTAAVDTGGCHGLGGRTREGARGW
jgi:hypothetical protein